MTDPSRSALLPIASYRVQLTPEHGFAHAVGLLDHLVSLGISHVYLSPVTEAVPGSTHGYDVVDHTRVRAELGGAEGLDRLLEAAASRGMSVIIDHVPNHCSTSRPELNAPWWSMLRDGPGSAAAAWFDVDRTHPTAGGRVLLAVLRAPLDQVLADGGVEISPPDELVPEPHLLVHGGLRLPLAPGTEPPVGTDLSETLARQHYELRWWRDPDRNVRRFFTIDDLVAVRVEEPAVAELVDAVPARLAGRPGFGGVRVDHVDGLAEPESYLRGLRDRIGPDARLLVEKILAPGERLPDTWPVDGTTGYEFARSLDHVMTAPGAAPTLDAMWSAAVAQVDDERIRGGYHEVEDLARREVLSEGLAPDLARTVVAIRLGLTADDARPSDAVDDADIARVVEELTVSLPRYRTYLPDDPAGDQVLGAVEARVCAGRPDLEPLVRRIVALLRTSGPDDENGDGRHPRRRALARWQQLTGPAMAKGAEDRAFYRYLRWPSLCEVGGDPGRCGTTVDEFHEAMSATASRWPRTMVTVSTHDTKRAAHVRARAAALSTEHEAWATAVEQWLPTLRQLEPTIRPTTLLHAIHTVVTCPGLDAGRLTAFLVKSAREAELRTAWTEVDPDHEARLQRLAEILLGDHEVAASIGRWAERLDRPGREAALVATVVRYTVPGVPDTYQGTEMPSYRLVDPDNRIPPDWATLTATVRAAASLDLAEAWREHDGAAEAVAMSRIAALRRRRPAAFLGDHVPITVSGHDADRVLAYRRGDEVVVVTALPGATLDGRGGATLELPTGEWRHVLVDPRDADIAAGAPTVGPAGVPAGPRAGLRGGVATTVADLLGGLPVAVLERIS